MKLQRVFFLGLWMLCTIGIKAQIGNAIRGIFQSANDSVMMADSTTKAVNAKQDSSLVVQLRQSLEEAKQSEVLLQQSLEEAKLNEANLRLEFEQFKLSILASDSLKRHKQKQFIDSLRKTTQGSPVMVDGDTLFHLYTKKGGRYGGEQNVMTSNYASIRE